jgi:N-methylhydantoinase B
MAHQFDPITLEILWRRLISIVDEADAAVYRTAFSSLIRDAHDYTNAIFDRKGRELAEGSSVTPGLLGALSNAVRVIAEKTPEASHKPGDILISNDPWLLSGHLNDICLVTPVFHKSKVVAFTSCIFHHTDIGGRPGAEAHEVYEEGIFIPLMKLADGGVINQSVLEMIRWNVRRPEDVTGDLRSQMAANHVCAEKIIDMLEEYGLDTLDDLANDIIGRTEQSMRNAILAIPDGSYPAQTMIEGVGDVPDIKVALRVDVKGSDITVDFAGTDPQWRWGVNSVLNFTYSYVNFAIKSAFNPEIPNNHGSTRPVRVQAPEGSIVNCTYPAPVAHRTMVGHRMTEIVYQALSQIAPKQVLAECGTAPGSSSTVYGTRADGRRFLAMDLRASGMGASFSGDGVNCTHFPANSSNTPCEILESDTPLIVEKREILADSGGPGRRRGGLGQEVVWRVPEGEHAPRPPVTVATVMARVKEPPHGMFGGKPGTKGRYQVNGRDVPWGGLNLCNPGDTLRFVQPGGGGYGDPLERELDLVLADVRNEYVSVQQARDEYGVVIDPKSLTVDEAATSRLRAERRTLSRVAE